MASKRRVPALLAATALSVAGADAYAGDAALQAMCFPKDQLAAHDGERVPVRGNHTFDRDPNTKLELAPYTPVAAPSRGAVRRVDLPKGEKLIALTFDLCEQHGEVAGYDGGIFDYLRAEGVHATLFAGGKWMRSHSERIGQLMTDPLFEIGNHAEAHRNLRLLDAAGLQAEILGPQRAYEAAVKRLPEAQCVKAGATAMQSVAPRLSLFRFPYGACNPASLNAVNDAGLVAIQWDLSSGDPDPRVSAKSMAESVVRRIKPGSIVVMHANGRGWNTAAALPLMIPKLRALGYQFVTVGTLMARGKPVVDQMCYDSRPGDTDRYDHFVSLTGAAKSSTKSDGAAKPWQDATTVTAKKRAPQTAKARRPS